MEEKPLGKVVHYYDKAMVAVIRLDGGGLKVGDELRFVKFPGEFSQTIQSMQIEREAVDSAEKGQEIAGKVSQPAKEGTVVYKA
mgnify:CR=1 FL=1